jgi:16S rRNA (guanine527-N7)-methyltransferase
MRINLVSRNDLENFARRHFLDSISPLLFFKPSQDSTILDIGSGAGFPAIPMKILRSDLRFTLVESTRKKVRFLTSTASLMGFDHFTPLWSRIENLESEGEFDVVTSRATATPEFIAQYAYSHLRPGGKMILFIGPNVKNEIKNIYSNLSEQFLPLIFNKSPFTDKDFYVLVMMKSSKV